jgi:hypothetical protein
MAGVKSLLCIVVPVPEEFRASLPGHERVIIAGVPNQAPFPKVRWRKCLPAVCSLIKRKTLSMQADEFLFFLMNMYVSLSQRQCLRHEIKRRQ